MDFLVKIANTGEFKSYPNIETSQKIGVLQQKIEADFHIGVADQILLTKKGMKVCGEDVIARLATENIFQMTTQLEDQSAQLYSLYVFSSRDEALPDHSSQLHPLDVHYLLDNKLIPEGVPQNGDYLAIQNKVLDYLPKWRLLERVIQQTDNQIQSFDVILKQASVNFTSTKLKKNELIRRLKDSVERNGYVISRFTEGMDSIKRYELHPALQTERKKHLLDVYYDVDSILKWKNNCLDSQTQLKLKSDKLVLYMKNLKKKIKEERNVTINNSIQQYKQQKHAFDQYKADNQGVVLSLLSLYAKGQATPEQLDIHLTQIGQQTSKVEALLEQVLSFKHGQQSLIDQMHRLMEKHIMELKVLNCEKLKHFEEQLDKLDKDFSYLLNPSQLPSAYNKALREISRRREFTGYLARVKTECQAALDKESKLRNKFISQYGRVLPNDFIPQLKQQVPKVSYTYENNTNLDLKLPPIDNYHMSEYASQTENGADLEELQKLLVNTHLYYKDEQPSGSSANDLLQKTCLFHYQLHRNKTQQLTQMADKRAQQQSYYENMIKADKAESEERERQLKQRVKDLETELNKQKDKLKVIGDNHDQVLANRQIETEKVQDALETALKEQQVYEKQMGLLQTNIEGLQAQLKAKDHELGNLKNRKDNCELVIQQRNAEIERLARVNREVEHKANEQAQKHQGVVAELQASLHKLQQQVQLQDKTILENKNKEIATLQAQVGSLKSTVAGMTQQQENTSKGEGWKGDQKVFRQILEGSVRGLVDMMAQQEKNTTQRLADLLVQHKKVHRRVQTLRQHKLQKTQLRKPAIPKLKVMEQEHTMQPDVILEKYQVQMQKCEIDQSVLFIPIMQGLYIPLVVSSEALPGQLLDSNNSETSRISQPSPGCVNLFLDVDSVDFRFRSLLQNCSLMVVAKVKGIVHRKNTNNQMPHLKPQERYVLVQIDTPSFVLGVEDDNCNVIKNYTDLHQQIDSM